MRGADFDEIEEDVSNLYEDFGLTEYPANPFTVAKLLKIETKKYSDVKPEEKEFMVSKYEHGFSIMIANQKYIIYYNDLLPKCTVNFTIWYEIGHIQRGHLYNDMNQSQAKMQSECNHFAVFAQAGMPFVFMMSPKCPNDLMETFGIGWECANYVFDNYLYIRQFPNIRRKILSSKILEVATLRKDMTV